MIWYKNSPDGLLITVVILLKHKQFFNNGGIIQTHVCFGLKSPVLQEQVQCPRKVQKNSTKHAPVLNEIGENPVFPNNSESKDGIFHNS